MLEFKLYALNVISMSNFPWIVSTEETHIFYKVVVNGVSHCFTDEHDAKAFAKSVNANVFEVTDRLVHRAPDTSVRKCHMTARTLQYKPRYYSTGSLEEIIKNVVDAYNDECVKEIKILF